MMVKKCLFCLAVFWWFFPRPSEAENMCNFTGSINFPGKTIHLTLNFKDGSSLIAQFVSESKDKFRFSGTIDHAKTPLLDVSSIVESTIEAIPETDGSGRFWRGAIESKYSLINYKPARELSGNFEIRKGRLYLNQLSWGGFICDGFIGLFSPHEIGLSLQLVDIAMGDLHYISGCKEDSRLFGTVSGHIELSGSLGSLFLRGKLLASSGAIEDLSFDNLVANFDGTYPVIHITDSSITGDSGLSFNIEGNLDLTNQCNLLAGITGLKMSPVVGENNLYREWTIKRNQETERSTTEFKYRLQKKENEGTTSKEDAGMLSVEHSIKF